MSLHFYKEGEQPTQLTPFGKQCRKWRQELSIIVYDQAAITGMKPSYISGIEVGRITPTEDDTRTILEFFRKLGKEPAAEIGKSI